MSGFDQSSIAVSMPTVVGADAALGGPYKIKPSEAFSGGLMTISGLTGETISVQTSPDGYQGAPANPSFYRTDWQGTQLLYSTARTNRVTFSQDLNSWTKTGAPVITTGALTLGALSMDLVDDQSAAVRADFLRGVALVGNGEKALDLYVAQGTATTSAFRLQDATAAAIRILGVITWSAGVPIVTMSNGTFDGVDSLGGGIFRIKTRGAGIVAANTNQVIMYPAANAALAATFTGSIYVGGFQIPDDGAHTSYIQTAAAAVTITDYTLSNGVITLAEVPAVGATLSYDNSVLPSPYYIFATGDGVRTQFAYDGVWGTLPANSGKGNGIWQVDLRGAQAYRLVKSAGSETATVNMTLKRDALQYTNSAGTWSVT